jgi:hypothetical protein
MADTLSGVIGRFAVPLATAELDPELDLVATQLHQMEGRLVTSKTLALLKKMITAVNMHVQLQLILESLDGVETIAYFLSLMKE